MIQAETYILYNRTLEADGEFDKHVYRFVPYGGGPPLEDFGKLNRPPPTTVLWTEQLNH